MPGPATSKCPRQSSVAALELTLNDLEPKKNRGRAGAQTSVKVGNNLSVHRQKNG